MMALPLGFQYVIGRLHVRTATGGWRPATKYERGRIQEMREAHEAGDTKRLREVHAKIVAKLNYHLDNGR